MSLSNPIRYHVYIGETRLPEARPYDYVLAANGVFKRVSTRHFMACFCVAAGKPIAGLLPHTRYVKLFIPRIPARWLTRVLEHAQRAVDRRGPVGLAAEAMYHFHYFPGGPGWRVAVPQQRGMASRVTYRGGDEPTVVLDLHSHHEMGAFFTATDNRDELGCRFYAVIGHIYTRPEIRLRLGVYGDYINLPASTLFDGLGPFVEALDESVINSTALGVADRSGP